MNIGTGKETTLWELAGALLEAMDGDVGVDHVDAREGDVMNRRQADTVRADRMIGFRAKVGLEEGLERTVDWWRNR